MNLPFDVAETQSETTVGKRLFTTLSSEASYEHRTTQHTFGGNMAAFVNHVLGLTNLIHRSFGVNLLGLAVNQFSQKGYVKLNARTAEYKVLNAYAKTTANAAKYKEIQELIEEAWQETDLLLEAVRTQLTEKEESLKFLTAVINKARQLGRDNFLDLQSMQQAEYGQPFAKSDGEMYSELLKEKIKAIN